MLTTIIFSLLVATSSARLHCDKGLIARTLKQIEIADYDPSATPPPFWVVGDLYRVVARNVAQCAGASHHYMGSRLNDLIQAAIFSKFAAQAYFDAREPSHGCAMLREAQRQGMAAVASSKNVNHLDRLYLGVNRKNVVSIQELMTLKCHT